MKQLTKLLATGLLALAAHGAQAQTVNSWNLSRDMMNSTTQGPVWYFLSLDTNVAGASYKQMDTIPNECTWSGYGTDATVRCWENSDTLQEQIGVIDPAGAYPSSFYAYSGKRGMVRLHPNMNRSVAVGWKAPRAGTFLISGNIQDVDNNCGDGIAWSVQKKNALNTLSNILAPQTIDNGGHTSFAATTAMQAGEMLYLNIDKRGDHYCDSTIIDLMVTTSN